VRGVRKSFGDLEVLRGIDLTVRPGEVTAILGPSGSGKSTLLRTINHLETIDAGLITLDGEVIGYRREGNLLHELPEREVLRQRTQVGMVFQGFNLFAHMTALQNVAEAPRRALGVPKRIAEARARELLALVGLAEKSGEHPRRLSGGQQQRVAIARALALDPKVLLFDEPTSALDPELVEEVLAVIRRLARQGTTLMIVTHEISFARSVADTVVFMDRGAIVEQGPPSAVIDHPARDRTRSFLQRVRTGEEEASPRQDAPAPAHREGTTSPSHAASIPTSVPRPAEGQSRPRPSAPRRPARAPPADPPHGHALRALASRAHAPRTLSRRALAATGLLLPLSALAACSDPAPAAAGGGSDGAGSSGGSGGSGGSDGGSAAPDGGGASGGTIDTSGTQELIRSTADEAIAALLPPEIAETGTLRVGINGTSPAPLYFLSDDIETYIGSEIDIARIVADKLGLEFELKLTTWENWPLKLEA